MAAIQLNNILAYYCEKVFRSSIFFETQMPRQPSNYKFKGGGILRQAIEEHYMTIVKLAYTYVKNREMAQDIAQDVCERALRKEAQFRNEASLKTYLIRMTINRSYDYLRSWKYKQQALTDQLRGLLHLETPEMQALKNDEQTALARHILKLKPMYREVIVLYYYEDFSVAEIAAILEKSENTVKTRLKRARQQLKEKIEWEDEIDA